MHRSLVTRLLVTSILITLCATVASAWLTLRSTTRAIQQERGQSLAADKSVYDLLAGYAATHRDWSGVGAVVAEQSAKLGRRITVTTEDRQILADVPAGPPPHDTRPSATVDPLLLDLGLTGGSGHIDARVVGPYLLPAAERRVLRRAAAREVACAAAGSVASEIVDGPSGRPTVRVTGFEVKDAMAQCLDVTLLRATATELPLLTALRDLTASCLGLSDPAAVEIAPDFTLRPTEGVDRRLAAELADRAAIDACIEKSRQTQLRPYVAPPALLFVTPLDAGDDQPVLDLSRANLIRIGWVSGVVLGLVVLVTVLAGRRLVRPLRALTEAARRPVDDQRPLPVTANDEIGVLATALNDLTGRRQLAERQRKALVNDVAHELRTPLTNMRSWLEAAQDGLVPVDPRLLALLLEESEQLRHIVDDLRDLAAAEAGTLRLHPEPIYLSDVVAQVADSHRGAAENGRVDLRTEVAGNPEMTADPVRLRQLLGNLVSNAIRHTPPGGAVLISVHEEAGDLVTVVTDTGPGIAAEDLPRVFDRFWRADSSRSRITGGSGLGLPIARNLARAHGGDITVANGVTGAVLTVRLPSGER